MANKLGETPWLPHVKGVNEFASQETVDSRYGKPDHVATSKDGMARLLTFRKYNVAVELQKNTVIGVGMVDGQSDPIVDGD